MVPTCACKSGEQTASDERTLSGGTSVVTTVWENAARSEGLSVLSMMCVPVRSMSSSTPPADDGGNNDGGNVSGDADEVCGDADGGLLLAGCVHKIDAVGTAAGVTKLPWAVDGAVELPAHAAGARAPTPEAEAAAAPLVVTLAAPGLMFNETIGLGTVMLRDRSALLRGGPLTSLELRRGGPADSARALDGPGRLASPSEDPLQLPAASLPLRNAGLSDCALAGPGRRICRSRLLPLASRPSCCKCRFAADGALSGAAGTSLAERRGKSMLGYGTLAAPPLTDCRDLGVDGCTATAATGGATVCKAGAWLVVAVPGAGMPGASS